MNTLPIKRDLSLAYAFSLFVVFLLAAVSVGGLLFPGNTAH